MRTQHVSSRAPNTRELIIDIFEKVSLSPYIFLYEFAAIVALVRTRNRHLVPNFLVISCLQSKGTRISSSKQDDFLGFRSIRSLTSRRWLQKSDKHVGLNFTLKPNTKASSLQFSKTEIKTNRGYIADKKVILGL